VINTNKYILESSFRDPDSFVFLYQGEIYRQINNSYKENYLYLKDSGLYDVLVSKNYLLEHREVELPQIITPNGYKILKPQKIEFISYPPEWCFSQLKDAALLTLEIQKIALRYKMSLKDASAYNIQFYKGKPILIDIGSFEKYERKPWAAYKQFCQHFLAPLALMCYKDIRLNKLLNIFLDGIPLDLVSKMLPFSTYFNLSLLFHIHLHAKSQCYFSDTDKIMKIKSYNFKEISFNGLIDSLESCIRKMELKQINSVWSNYYRDFNYSNTGFRHKIQIIEKFVEKIRPRNVWDLGSNEGIFSQMIAEKGIFVVSLDMDPIVVEKNYLKSKAKREKNLLPLVIDLTNPTPSFGWQNKERVSFLERGPTDMAIALALIHHLAISNNLPLDYIANFFYNICTYLIIEFIPKDDLQVEKLLLVRKDIFNDYTQENFEKIFRKYFIIEDIIKIIDSKRVIYLMKKQKI